MSPEPADTPAAQPDHHEQPAGAPLAETAVAGPLRRRPALTALAAALAVLVVLVAGVGLGSVLGGRGDTLAPVGRWEPALSPTRAGLSPSPAPDAPPVITMSAVGDIILGDAGRLPAADGAGFFDGVVEALAADLVMGNLEQPLTGDTGYHKCDEDATACHAFRAPPHYAAHLVDAGFDLMNLANNHGNDYGPAGRENTKAALTDHGIAYTGERDHIEVVEARGVTVAVVGFTPYAWTNDLNDHDQAAGVVAQAAQQADLVVVQVHMGAEGSDATRVRPGTETFYGENRGDPMAFSRAVIDAGADLVVGHGPHVLRGLEFYRGRLIAYSLGNFAGGGGTLSNAGNLGLGAVLRVALHSDGTFAGGQLISTHMYDAGLPKVDPQQRGLALITDVTGTDFQDTGAELGPDGEINEPT